MRTIRTAEQIREELQHACALRHECDDCYLGVVRTDPDADGCNWSVVTTSLSGERDACPACVRAAAAECERIRRSVMLPPADLTIREIESLQNILVVRELGIRSARAVVQPGRVVEMGYAYVAADGRLDVSRAGREMLRRL